MQAVDVAIVGGGFAGLIAARDLEAAGKRVIVLEARDRLGGRTYYRRFADTDEQVEFGGAWFNAPLHTPLHEEAERYGIPIGPATAYQTVRWFTGGELRAGLPVGRWDGGDLERVIVEISIAARGLATATPEEKRAHDIPVSQWLDRLAPLAATRDFVYAWISVMAGAHPDDHPMLAMLTLLNVKGNAYSFYSDTANMLPHGTAALVAGVAGDISGEIRLATPVWAIRQTAGGVTVESSAGAISATLCILAVPVNAMGAIEFDPPLEPRRAHALAQGALSRPTKLWMLAAGVPDRMLGAGWNTPFYWLAAERQVADAQLIVAFALEGAVDPSDVAVVERALRDYAPDARVLAADHHDWVEDAWSRGGWMTEPPGWASEGLLDLIAQPHGRVLMAGSDVAPQFAGWIAGWIASGRAAALEALGQLEPHPVQSGQSTAS